MGVGKRCRMSMMNPQWLRAGVLLAAALWTAGCAHVERQTALDRYVAKPDPSYRYQLVGESRVDGCGVYVLELTSQTWLTTNEVDRPVWKHWLTVIKPPELGSSTGLLFITGGDNNKPAPTKPDGNLVRVARESKTIVSELRMVPNQPLTFHGEKEGRVEDSLIAYTWDKYLRTGDEKWPARLPMTKSAVRAMDAITDFCAGSAGGGVKVDRFVVAGGSKRGWTTWTTAAVDKRVVGLVPIVIDLLNIEPSFQHHYQAYGFWAPAVDDYTRMGIMDWSGTPQYRALMKIEEPYEYRQRLTMPKFLINASGDQFFLPDSARFYFRDLPGTKYLRYVPNADHSLKGSDAFATLLASYHALVYHVPLPRFDWTIEKDGALRVATQTAPTEVKLWQATNPKARDFRLDTLGPAWQGTVLTPETAGVYVGRVPVPAAGWTAFFVELTFPSSGPAPFKYTTEVRVLPDTLPFAAPKPAMIGDRQGGR